MKPKHDKPKTAYGRSTLTEGLVGPFGEIIVVGKAKADKALSLVNPRVVGSYNWLSRAKPTIAVPGGPPIWSPPSPLPKLGPDVIQDVNNNAAGLQGAAVSSADLLLRAVTTCTPDLPLHGIDVVTDRNNLRKLAGLFRSRKAAAFNGHDEFRIGAEVVGQTLVLSRWESRDQEVLARRSFSRGFIHAATSHPGRGPDKVASSYAVIACGMGPLNMLIRFGVDAALPADSLEHEPALDGHQGGATENMAVAEVTAAMKGLGMGGTNSGGDRSLPSTALNGPGITHPQAHNYDVVRCGYLPALENLIEIKTRTADFPYDPTDMQRQALWSGPTWVFVGRHRVGNFGAGSVERFRWGDTPEETGLSLRLLMAEVADLLVTIKAAILKTVGSGVRVALVRGGRFGLDADTRKIQIYRYGENEVDAAIGPDMRGKLEAGRPTKEAEGLVAGLKLATSVLLGDQASRRQPYRTSSRPIALHEGLSATANAIVCTDNTQQIPKSTRLGGTRLVGSYTWLGSDTPEPIIPASLPNWRKQMESPCIRVERSPLPLPGDEEFHLSGRGVNPLNNALRAVDTLQPAYPFDELDVVVDRFILQRMASFVDDPHFRWSSYRLHAHVVGGTLLLTARDSDLKSLGLIEEDSFQPGYVVAVTAEEGGEKKAVSASYAIAESRLDGLKLLVRFKVDAKFPKTPAVKGLMPNASFTKAARVPCISAAHGNGIRDPPARASEEARHTAASVVDSAKLSITQLVEVQTLGNSRYYDLKAIRKHAVWPGAPLLHIKTHDGGEFAAGPVQMMRVGRSEERESEWTGIMMGKVAGILREIRKQVVKSRDGKRMAVILQTDQSCGRGEVSRGRMLRFYNYQEGHGESEIELDLDQKMQFKKSIRRNRPPRGKRHAIDQ